MGRVASVCLTVCASIALLTSTVSADVAKVFFWQNGTPYAVERQVPPGAGVAESALGALVLGPTPQEQAMGISSPIAAGATISSITTDERSMAVDFSGEIIGPGFSEIQVQAIYKQVYATLDAYGVSKEALLTSRGSYLSSYLASTSTLTTAPASRAAAMVASRSGAGVPLRRRAAQSSCRG